MTTPSKTNMNQHNKKNMNKLKKEKVITIWACPVCKKWDTSIHKEPMAKPEHIPYRGIDLGECPGTFVKINIKLKDLLEKDF
jgi:hypothetical protein